jgi:hypothetical protein
LIRLICDFGEQLTTQIINVLRNEHIQCLWFGGPASAGNTWEVVHHWLEVNAPVSISKFQSSSSTEMYFVALRPEANLVD